MKLSEEQIQGLLRVGNPTDEECRLIRMGWDAAMRTNSAPEGWKLVPIVSTHEMKEAGACAGAVYYAISKDVWSAMLAAAPEAKRVRKAAKRANQLETKQ